ncbi:MAG: hypothetical protein JSS68_06455 [Actinobacteria bacterium]|nr:hypothetical protein [Actinomycetota bacterium]MBS1881953.1 hypothetical protein [Actinomycetota bacterium]
MLVCGHYGRGRPGGAAPHRRASPLVPPHRSGAGVVTPGVNDSLTDLPHGRERSLSRIRRNLVSRLARSATFGQLIRETLSGHYFVFGGPQDRVEIASGVVLNDALLNVSSGGITIGEHTFFGHGVSLLTGTHDIAQFGLARQRAIPAEGRDIRIGRGAWISSNATVLGPCSIGDDAVVAAGAVVTQDVPPGAIVAGVPAKIVGSCKQA